MKLNLIRRIAAMAALSAMALTGAVVSAEPLPVPDVPGAEVKGRMFAIPVLELHYPLDGTAITHLNALSWTNVEADGYVLKMVVQETGQRITKKFAPDMCNSGYCVYHPNKVDFYPLVKDGQTVKWKVTAKFVDGGQTNRSTSNARTFIVDEINAPVLLEGVISTELRWEVDNATVKWQILFIKNMKTGAVKKVKFDTNGGCSNPCVYYPADVEQDTEYKWWVKAKGYTGENALSAKETFFVASKS